MYRNLLDFFRDLHILLIRNFGLHLQLGLQVVDLLAKEMVLFPHSDHVNSFFLYLVGLFSEVLLYSVDDFLLELEFSREEFPPVPIILIVIHFIINYYKWEIT